jgi:hypothetical protein
MNLDRFETPRFLTGVRLVLLSVSFVGSLIVHFSLGLSLGLGAANAFAGIRGQTKAFDYPDHSDVAGRSRNKETLRW